LRLIRKKGIESWCEICRKTHSSFGAYIKFIRNESVHKSSYHCWWAKIRGSQDNQKILICRELKEAEKVDLGEYIEKCK
jgi:hypothetical protein